VNHATLLIQTENVNILTDPIWSERCSPVQFMGPKRHHAPGVRFEDLPPVDVVLLSHNHYDHMDVATLERLKREHKPRIYAGLGNGAFVEGAVDLDWWQSAEVAPGVRVHSVPAQHFSSRGLGDRDANLWCGWIIETPHGPLYFAGDTGWGGHFAKIRERFGDIRVAMLPIGAFRPVWFMSPVHIGPKDAVRAAQVLNAAVSIPMHYTTFHLGDDGQDEPAEVLRKELEKARGVRFEILRPGETLVR
jgi:L-ascorbate metabolism protein UlaG (beta-lactamase superfamily)